MITQNSPILEVNGLNVNRNGAPVIEGATFTINRGDYVGIVGPNGGGKTTLLRVILNFLPYTQGFIKLFDTNLTNFSSWEKIAYISQQATNFEEQFPLTVRELVSLGCIKKGRLGRNFTSEDWKNVDNNIEFMGLSNVANRRIGQLSGGQKQRMFVAKALTHKPELIILDEPIVGVDSNAQEKFYKKLSDLNIKHQTTILIVTHDLASVFCRMSKILCINKNVELANITPNLDTTQLLKRAYGEHFHFVFHQHSCEGEFPHEH
ncbi:MAG: metal ABC transporter ATP-binding protein [Candidatus Bathyarchaeota archaeon]|uniref:metal ABC transporter ATP-binding protein n=1 Tax=Candidatus Bathycorpusculum sp. TaxID=2994959 RepID=UPI002826B482|nr:metal ABC transporter ATP-binding protein [Candidatus Termiticorpusculum sp.]MCL2257164.1 metal ABC transporter ATP-binding protein [Candidatus Termiticorpusculum sp.]MCL2292532.1 metal ABC transporter ATP-binding protein [Candidatus Termiticorpusculum sp.]